MDCNRTLQEAEGGPPSKIPAFYGTEAEKCLWGMAHRWMRETGVRVEPLQIGKLMLELELAGALSASGGQLPVIGWRPAVGPKTIQDRPARGDGFTARRKPMAITHLDLRSIRKVIGDSAEK